jgi:hypothetical protein
MNRKLAAVSLSILVALPSREVLAAEPPPLEPGRLVRIWTDGLSKPEFEGIVVSLDDSTITLEVARRHTRTTVLRDRIAALDVSAGARSGGRQALAGTLVGALAGACTGLVVGSDDHGLFSPNLQGPMAAVFGSLGALVGLLVGAALPAGQKWKKVPAERFKLSLSLPRGGGVGASVSLGF